MRRRLCDSGAKCAGPDVTGSARMEVGRIDGLAMARQAPLYDFSRRFCPALGNLLPQPPLPGDSRGRIYCVTSGVAVRGGTTPLVSGKADSSGDGNPATANILATASGEICIVLAVDHRL